MKNGYTLLELIAALSLIGIGLSIPATQIGSMADRWAVQAAREGMVAAHFHARSIARDGEGALLEVDVSSQTVRVTSGGTLRRTIPVGKDLGVVFALGGASTTAQLRFDPLGIGRSIGHTVTFSRGGESVQLVVSGFGRVRRR